MAEQARRHHLVSKFYLRYFADERDHITTVMLPGDRRFTQNIRDASVNNGFYTVIDNDGHESDLAEKALAEIEGPASGAWREVALGAWPLPEEHRVAMASWLALQLLRGTRMRNSMSELATHALLIEACLGGRTRVREALAAEGRPLDDDTVNAEWVSFFTNPYRAQVHANHHMRQLADTLPHVTESLLDRAWLLTVFERKTLATSDHPVHVVENPALREMGLGTGIDNAEVIHAPLTRRLSLAMYEPSAIPPQLAALRQDTALRGVAATALYSNSCVVNSARRFLFHHPEDAPLAGFDLHEPRDREMQVNAQLWGWIAEDDRHVLLDAGFGPEDLDALLDPSKLG